MAADPKKRVYHNYNKQHPLRRRFALHCEAIFAGMYHLDGTFNGAARYRHCGRNDVWILYSEAFNDNKDDMSWKMAGHPKCQQCTAVEIGLDNNAKGRIVDGIIEIPTEGWFTNHRNYGPYTFRWISDDHCGDPTYDALEGKPKK